MTWEDSHQKLMGILTSSLHAWSSAQTRQVGAHLKDYHECLKAWETLLRIQTFRTGRSSANAAQNAGETRLESAFAKPTARWMVGP